MGNFCKKAKVLQLANQPVAASEVLKEARAIGDRLNIGQDSQLKALIKTKVFLRLS